MKEYDDFDLAYHAGTSMTVEKALECLREAMVGTVYDSTERDRDLLLTQVEGFLNNLRLLRGGA